MTQSSPVDALLADCRRVTEAIAGHRQAVTDLTAERDGMVVQLRTLGLSERAVGRLLGISGPRVNQITHPAQDAPEPAADAGQAADERRMAAARRWESPGGTVPAESARAPRKAAARAAEPPAVVPGSGTAGAPPVVLQPPETGPPVRDRGLALDATGQPCTHPKARVFKGLCRACGTFVGDSR